MNRLRHWLKPPVFDTEEETSVARTLFIVLGVYIAIFTIGAISSVIFASAFGSRLLLTLAAALSGVIMLAILRAGHLRLASALLISVSLLVSAYFTVTAGGVERPAASLFLVTIVFAGLALGKAAILITFVISLIADLVFYFMKVAGVLPAPVVQLVPTSALVTQLITLLAISACLYLVIGNLEQAINRVKASERVLTERNRALEQEIVEHKRTAERLRLASEAGKIRMWEWDVVTDRVISEGYLFDFMSTKGRVNTGFFNRQIEQIHPEDRERIIAVARRLREEEGAQSEEFRLRSPDGEYVWVQIRAEGLRDASGKVTHLIGVYQDITERKQAEQERLELAVERGKLAALRDFLDTVSHDLKTPLSTIATSLYLIERLDDPDTRGEHLRQIKRQTKLVEKYIQDILLMSRLDHVPDLALEKRDLNMHVRQAEADVRLGATFQGVEVRLDLEPTLSSIQASATELGRLVTNLLENAVTYTPKGGSVVVRTYQDAAHVVLEVTDTGIGIAPEDIPRIFETFFRTEEARQQSMRGTGLGLPIVKRIVELYGGQIQVESQLGQGSTFRVFFPAVD